MYDWHYWLLVALLGWNMLSAWDSSMTLKDIKGRINLIQGELEKLTRR